VGLLSSFIRPTAAVSCGLGFWPARRPRSGDGLRRSVGVFVILFVVSSGRFGMWVFPVGYRGTVIDVTGMRPQNSKLALLFLSTRRQRRLLHLLKCHVDSTTSVPASERLWRSYLSICVWPRRCLFSFSGFINTIQHAAPAFTASCQMLTSGWSWELRQSPTITASRRPLLYLPSWV